MLEKVGCRYRELKRWQGNMSDSLNWDLAPFPDSNAFICSYYVKMKKKLGDGLTIKLSCGGISI